MLACALAAALDGSALGQSQWATHIDASQVNEIVERDGKLYCATGGGLLVYDPATDTFEQFTNVDGLLSNAPSALVPSGANGFTRNR
jgi:hypothetical protein